VSGGARTPRRGVVRPGPLSGLLRASVAALLLLVALAAPSAGEVSLVASSAPEDPEAVCDEPAVVYHPDRTEGEGHLAPLVASAISWDAAGEMVFEMAAWQASEGVVVTGVEVVGAAGSRPLEPAESGLVEDVLELRLCLEHAG
jgi:hypothetical protein